jgi:hypothetical protein
MRLRRRPADGFSGHTVYSVLHTAVTIFIINFNAIFRSKIEHSVFVAINQKILPIIKFTNIRSFLLFFKNS